MKKLIILLILLLVPTFVYSFTYNYYGVGIGADGLGNLEIGKYAGRKLAYRFKAEKSGTVDELRIFLIYAEGGYYAGDGGEVKVAFYTDDGTGDHFPDTEITSETITNPMAENFPLITFDPQVEITAGTIYHIVFTNPDAAPTENYVSLDNLQVDADAANVQPGWSDTDMQVLWDDSGGGWAAKTNKTPIFNITYTDDNEFGVGWVNAASGSGLRTISGANKVRESFTVSGGARKVISVAVFVKKTDGTSGLVVRLETSGESLIEEGTIDAGDISDASYTWVTFTFVASHMLSNSASYNLVLSSVSGTYTTFHLQEGTGNGFADETVFTDGKMEYNTGGGWTDSYGTTGDMMFYFGCVGPGAPLLAKNFRFLEE